MANDANKEHQPEDWPLARIVERNIRALLARRQAEEARKSRQQRVADVITRFTGSIKFVYIHIVLFGAWIVLNLPWFPWPKFDPTYVVLAMFASVEAIFLSTFVLMTQNRMAQQADRRAELDLQISLLAEHEVTRLLNLVSAIAEKMEVDVASDAELSELRKDVPPEKVLDAMEHSAWTPQG